MFISSHLSPLTLEVVGAPQITLQQYLPSFPVFRYSHGISKPNSRPFLDVISHLFFCLPLLLTPFTVPCIIVFAMSEDFEMWPYHLSFRFFTLVRRSSFTPIAFWFCCEPRHSSHCPCRKCSEVFYSISSQGLGSFSRFLLSRSSFHRHWGR